MKSVRHHGGTRKKNRGFPARDPQSDRASTVSRPTTTGTESTESTEITEKHPPGRDVDGLSVRSVLSVLSVPLAGEFTDALETLRTIPGVSLDERAEVLLAQAVKDAAHQGPWWNGIFSLARYLRRLLDLAKPVSGAGPPVGVNLGPDSRYVPWNLFRPLLDLWRRLGGLQVPVDEALAELTAAWRRIKDPTGHATLQAMAGMAEQIPDWATANYDSKPVQRLVGLCIGLAGRNPEGRFFVSCRIAAQVCGFRDHKAAAKGLRLLVVTDVLQIVDESGGGTHHSTMRARRYRYLSPDGQPAATPRPRQEITGPVEPGDGRRKKSHPGASSAVGRKGDLQWLRSRKSERLMMPKRPIFRPRRRKRQV